MSESNVSGLCIEDARNKIAEEKRKKEAAEAGNTGNDAESADETSTQKVPAKKGGEDNEIDPEDELMYAQAVQDQGGQSDDDMDLAQEDVDTRAVKRRQATPGQLGLPSMSSQPAKRRRSQSLDQSTPTRSQAVGQSPAQLGLMLPHRQQDQAKEKQQDITLAVPDHKTWPQCVSILDFKFSETDAGVLFACPPKLKKKDVQLSKWISEAVKLKPALLTLEKALSSGACVKLTEQNLKTAITAMKKPNSKTDKRLGYEKEENSENPFFGPYRKAQAIIGRCEGIESYGLSVIEAGNVGASCFEKGDSEGARPYQRSLS